MAKTAAGDRAVGTIGPNAVTQLIGALKLAGLDRLAAPIFQAAGEGAWLTDPPSVMVDERRVAGLHQAVRAVLPRPDADAVMTEAGMLTADYLLVNRIPWLVQIVMKRLPAWLAARILVLAIRAHAWTFAGTGRFRAKMGSPIILEIEGNPLCHGERTSAPVCAWHAAVFQQLFAVLVSPSTTVVETACEARGDACCRFVIDWRPSDQVIPSG
ncbi:MAG: bacteriochlorophyll 4-vinyl reductase [Rhodopila sp.]|jgi:divinyl protochlorophyllide a 8-vinyl-reductase